MGALRNPVCCQERVKLTHEEQVELHRRMKDGDADARNLLIDSIMSWAITFARRYAKNVSRTFDEILSDCCAGVMRAVERWEPEKGRLTTYATFHFRSRVHAGDKRGRFYSRPCVYQQELLDEHVNTTRDEPSRIVANREEVERVRYAMTAMTDRQSRFVDAFFGESNMTAEAANHGISKGRAQQLKNEGLNVVASVLTKHHIGAGVDVRKVRYDKVKRTVKKVLCREMRRVSLKELATLCNSTYDAVHKACDSLHRGGVINSGMSADRAENHRQYRVYWVD